MQRDRPFDVLEGFLFGVTLAEAAGQAGYFDPIATLFGTVDDHLSCGHGHLVFSLVQL